MVGAAAGDVVFLQADLCDLPFRTECFTTVLSMGMLHLFDDVEGFVTALGRSVTPDGQLFLSTLVAERSIGRRYLSMLHRAGEVATPRTHAQLAMALQLGASGRIACDVQGSMAFVTLGR